MYRFSDKTLRFWLVVFIVLTVAGLALSLYFGLSSAGGSLDDAAYNLNVIRESIVDFENYQDLTGENRGFRKSSGYIVLRRGTDGIWKLIYQSDKDLNKDRWTPEDLPVLTPLPWSWGLREARHTDRETTDRFSTLLAQTAFITYPRQDRVFGVSDSENDPTAIKRHSRQPRKQTIHFFKQNSPPFIIYFVHELSLDSSFLRSENRMIISPDVFCIIT